MRLAAPLLDMDRVTGQRMPPSYSKSYKTEARFQMSC